MIAGFFALSVAVIQISVAVYYARAAFQDDMAYEGIEGSVTISAKHPPLARRKPFIGGDVAKELLCSRVQFTNVDKLISFSIDASKFTLFAQDNEDNGAYTLGALIIKDNQRFLTRLHYKPKLIKKLDQVKSIISIFPVLIDGEGHIESIIHNPGLAYDEYGEGFWRFVLERDERWMLAC